MAVDAGMFATMLDTQPNTRLCLRPMQARDLSLVTEIARANMPYPWSRRLFENSLKPDYHAWVVSCSDSGLANDVMGFAVALVQVQECQLLNIGVRQRCRRQGAARRLLQEVEAGARAQQCRRILLEVRVSSEAAIGLYQRYGFIEVGQRKDYYRTDQGHEDALLFALDLLV